MNHNSPAGVSKVEKIVLDSIRATGPIPFSTYMQLCLSHPTHGYYMNPSHSVFGTRGDFITSPEISQVFGELVGVWLLSQWENAGQPAAIRLVELGPGRGTLMDDVLRVISRIVPGNSSINVHLVETSSSMRSLQEAKLCSSSRQAKFDIHWHHSVDDIPPSVSEYTMFFAHEFFDALPIHTLQKTETGWHEVLIDANPEYNATGDCQTEVEKPNVLKNTTNSKSRLRRVLSRSPSATSTLLGQSSPRFSEIPVGSLIEVSPASFRTARQVGELLLGNVKNQEGESSRSPGGCGLIIDYGDDLVFGDSFRVSRLSTKAFSNHKLVDVFDQPGDCDLTANVDFAYLREAVEDLVTVHGPIPQYMFLEKMGLQLRLDSLVRAAKAEARKTAIRDAAERLVNKSGMGTEYKVMGLTTVAKDGEKVWPFL
ncbi:hypothetical protein K443DRAFT_126999 [Laccaria amethystina LaAM-08-1]|uniref:Protein arginine methyltransferase NDUFAF7 n=1 Tax=Laccaria amethystina LaAM-08-1 TaxID=1095629 RepID=A0A0C9Y870_9AGAR|nr:hypothetical protein K443DRAFT_126999 [Laccaria amethystina LaAM-08-1]